MELQQHYLVVLRKGPNWTPESTPELDRLQEAHLAHLDDMREMGKLVMAGPVDVHAGSEDVRGILLFHFHAFSSADDLRSLVEADPMLKNQRLVADYMTWYSPPGDSLGS